MFKRTVIDNWLEVASGWDRQFEILLKKSQEFGKKTGITEQKIQQAIEKARASGG